jgi:hypothetical protein
MAAPPDAAARANGTALCRHAGIPTAEQAAVLKQLATPKQGSLSPAEVAAILAAADEREALNTKPSPSVGELAAEWWQAHQALQDAQADAETAIERCDTTFGRMLNTPSRSAAEVCDKLRVLWRESDYGRNIDSGVIVHYAANYLARIVKDAQRFGWTDLPGLDVDPEAERRQELGELAAGAADDDRVLVGRKLMGHAEGCRSAFLTSILGDRKVCDVPTAELKQLVDELDAAAEAQSLGTRGVPRPH